MEVIQIDTTFKKSPIRNGPHDEAKTLRPATASKHSPAAQSTDSNASLLFVGTATTVLQWAGLTLMTDPNFLHAGDHVHLGPGVTGTRKTNPYVDLEDLPPIDLVLLSHYHADHFDENVETNLRRDLPIVTTPHAKEHLANKGDGESFTAVTALDAWETAFIDIGNGKSAGNGPKPRVKVVGMPGKHVPPGPLNIANEILGAVPPTNGWLLELGHGSSASVSDDDWNCGYRIYISGDTLLIDDLKKIPEMYTHAGKPIDLMLIHLGGTTIPGPSLPLLMVTMDAKQGIQLVKLIRPNVTIPIHYE
jgi:L-ascorbate metabolism protein UlaG (beta-lactamase superfamily)